MGTFNRQAISQLSHRTDSHPSLLLSRVALLVVAVLFAAMAVAGLSVPMEAQMIIYLVGMIALNLPHGGYEHVANLRRRRPDFRWRYVAVYLAAVGAFLGLLLIAPVAGVALAVTVAMAKGGLGGVNVLEATSGTDHLRTRAQRLLAAGVRGGSVMLVPIVFWPETFHSFSALMVGLVEPGGLAPYAAYFDVTRPVIAAGYGLAGATHIGLGYLRGGGHSWRIDAGETLLLVTYFAVVPVVVAVGLYFPLWYSARQVAREQTVAAAPVSDDRWDLLGGDDPTTTALRAWGLLVVGALATVGVLAVIYWAVPNPFANSTLLAGAVAFWSIFISIIALPHIVVGSLWDRDRGIWYVP